PGREVVGDDHAPAVVEQRAREVRADEAGAAGDEHAATHPCPRRRRNDSPKAARSSASTNADPTAANAASSQSAITSAPQTLPAFGASQSSPSTRPASPAQATGTRTQNVSHSARGTSSSRQFHSS